jgi:two-component system phosphate regulon sensor histidine kinase PhoR
LGFHGRSIQVRVDREDSLRGSGGCSSLATDAARALAARVLSGSDEATRTTDELFVAARAVRSQNNRPLFVLLASRPTTVVEDVRERLFRTFYVIAFGGTLLALVLASVVGDRIGAGLRRLTRSAEQLERGEAGVRSGVRSEDEVGRLGAAFDSMAASIEEKTDALRQAALDEARLRNRVEAIVAGMGEALVAVDASGEITDLNDAAEELFGYTAEQAKTHHVSEVVRLRNDENADISERLTTDDSPRWSEVADIDVGGELIPIAITAGQVRGSGGEVAGRVFVLRDLRSEREVERMKREFLSRVGHELRTPLTPLLGFARILAGRGDLPADRARDIAQTMVSSGQRLERIVEMLEFFASAQVGRTVLRPESLDVRDLLAAVIDQRAETSNGHVLTRRVRSGTPRVIGDSYWLRRSIDELVDNAIKFSPGGGRVSVTAAPVGSFVEIAVRDTGVGMSPDERDRAFAEWSQGDESDTRAYGGLGLGLALVQRVVERHGGRVTCETAPGKGSKFSLLLPALPTDRGDAADDRGSDARRDDGGDPRGMPHGGPGGG